MDERYSLEMLKYISDMRNDIETSTMKAEFIIHSHACVHSPRDSKFEYLVMKYFLACVAKPGCTECTDEMVNTAFEDFQHNLNEHRKKHKSEKKELDNNNNNLDASAEHADRIFITFVRMFHNATKTMGDLEWWPSEKIVRTILDCMYDYYDNDWEWEQEPAEYFLDCLLTRL